MRPGQIEWRPIGRRHFETKQLLAARAASPSPSLPAAPEEISLPTRSSQIPAPIIFSIRGAETLQLRLFASVTDNCVSTFVGLDGIDILDGPPEIALKFEPGNVSVNTVAGRVCNPVSGGTIMITAAKDITEQQEANLTFRVRYRSKNSSSSMWTYRYHLLLFPAVSGSSGEQTSSK
jgi:hypothetical protein